VQGFAITLIIGIAASMVTAIFWFDFYIDLARPSTGHGYPERLR